MCRRKRAVDEEDDSNVRTSAALSSGPRVSNQLISSTDNVSTVPERPIHQLTRWPTPIAEEVARNQCEEAITTTPLYIECSQYTILDIVTYVNSCVADILVTSLWSRSLTHYIMQASMQVAFIKSTTSATHHTARVF